MGFGFRPALSSGSNLQYGLNVDLAHYSAGEGRTTLNGEGRAKAADVWRRFQARSLP